MEQTSEPWEEIPLLEEIPASSQLSINSKTTKAVS